MAGYGHGSVTGIDERTLGRIDLLLFDADYPSAADAVDDSWRVAVLAADPRVRADRDRAQTPAPPVLAHSTILRMVPRAQGARNPPGMTKASCSRPCDALTNV